MPAFLTVLFLQSNLMFLARDPRPPAKQPVSSPPQSNLIDSLLRGGLGNAYVSNIDDPTSMIRSSPNTTVLMSWHQSRREQ